MNCRFRIVCLWLALAAAMVILASSPVLALPRTWIGGNNNWIDGGSTAFWNPADEPDPDDEAIFNSANAVTLGSNNEVNGLTMSGGIDLDTNGFDLTVGGLVQLTGASTNLFIRGALSEIIAEDATINSGGAIELVGGTLTVDDNALFAAGVLAINAGGSLVGHGTVSLADSPLVAATLLNNNGTLTAVTRVAVIGQSPPANTLTINGGGVTARVDLDGSSEGGVVNINRNQTLDINVTLADAFNGTMNMFQNTTLGISTPWTLASGGSIVVDNGAVIGIPGVPAGTSTIAGGALTQTGGTINVVDSDGTLIFNAPLTTTGGSFINSGHVIFNASSTINLASFDFDAGEWTVQSNALLSINVTDYDPGVAINSFDSVITLNNGDISVITGDAEFVMNGTLNMIATSGITIWDGEPIDIGSDSGADSFLNVTGTENSRFGNPVTFKSDAVVNIAGGATLDFNNNVNFDTVNAGNNAEFTGAGRLNFNGAVNVNEAVTLNMAGGTVDLDGVDSAGDQINIKANLVINTQTMSSFGKTNGAGGVNVLVIDALTAGATGSLTVNLDFLDSEWTLNPQGTLTFLNSNALVTQLAGSDVNLNGSVNVTGAVGTAARVDIGGTVNILTAVPNGGFLLQGGSFADPNTIAGGLINGPGALQVLSGRALVGFGTINAGIDFGGTAQLIADDGTLAVNGTIFDVGTIGVTDDGVLDMGLPFSSGVTDNGIVMSGGTLQGAAVTTASIAKPIRGTGLVNSIVFNDGAIEAQGGTLTLNNINSDWDGGSNAGHLRATGGGTLHLLDTGTFAFGGSVIAVENSRVFTNGFGLNFSSASSLLLTQGTYESTNSIDVGGTVVVGAGAPSTIKVALNSFLDIESTASVTLNGNLRLESNNARIAAGATFGGAGALVVPENNSNLVLDPSANVNALVENHGTLYPGGLAGVGRADLKDYQQFDTGRLFIEIEGTSLNQYDRLVVNGIAQLDGYLNVDIDGPYVPVVGDTFNIIAATAGRTGTFDYLDTSGFPAGLTVKVNYLPTLVQLEVVNTPFFSADFDKDGDVDLTDYAIWRNAFGLNQLGDANGDNFTDAADYTLWRNQLGSGPGAGSGSAFAASVPEPTALVLLIGGVLTMSTGRRRRARQS